MNKIDFSKLGGFPQTQDSLEFLQEGLREGINATALTFADNGSILWGVRYSDQGGNAAFSSGAVLHNGEIVPVLSNSLGRSLLLGDVLALVFYDVADVTLDPTTYESGATFDVHRNRYARIELNTGKPGNIWTVTDEPNFFVKRYQATKTLTVSDFGATVTFPTGGGYEIPKIHKVGKRITFKGAIQTVNVEASGNVLLSSSANPWTPPAKKVFSVATGAQFADMTLNATGSISVGWLISGLSAGEIVNLDQIDYFIE